MFEILGLKENTGEKEKSVVEAANRRFNIVRIKNMSGEVYDAIQYCGVTITIPEDSSDILEKLNTLREMYVADCMAKGWSVSE